MFNMVLGLNWTSLFEYPPCSDLFHIRHCIIPRSQGCVWLVGWDVHLQVGHEMEVSNIGRGGLGPREHYETTFTFPPSIGFKRFLATLQSPSFLSPLIGLRRILLWNQNFFLQTITLWSVRWPQWPKSKSIRQRHQIGQNKPLFIDVKE